MGRILAIDFGSKRSGIATTDPLGIVATPLKALFTHHIFDFLSQYFKREEVEKVVVGWPKNIDGSDTNNTPLVRAFLNRFKKLFPSYRNGIGSYLSNGWCKIQRSFSKEG